MALTEPSPDGNLLLYGVAASGSDWQEFKIRRVTDGVDLSDHLRWIKFSGAAWTRDGKGFFYSRYPETRTGEAMVGQYRDMKVYYHRIGTVQTDDVLVYERPDQPDWGFGVHVTHDGRYLVMAVWVGTDTRQRIHYLDLVDPLLPKVTGTVARLLDHADAAYAFIGNQGPLFQFRTDRDAPRGRVIAIDTEAPGAEIRETIPEEPDALEQGGVYAQPNLRGGGEYGKAWHEAGMFEKKQNVFDDFVAAAEYLFRERYTSSDYLGMTDDS